MTDETPLRSPGGGDAALWQTERALAFEHAPTSMWLQDLRLLKRQLDAWRLGSVADLRAFLAADPARVEALVSLVRVLAVNTETLRLYEVADEAELFARIRPIFGEDQIGSFVEVICQLFAGARRTGVVTRNYTARGRALDVSYKGRLLPGHEADWSAYLICVEDVSVQQAALRELEAARRRDPLTGLFNRAFLIEEMDRLEASPGPVALVVIDLNGLKAANDRFGHKAGDRLLQAMARLLVKVLPPVCPAVRLGGDEFVAVLAGRDRHDVAALLARLGAEAERAGDDGTPLSFSIGIAWREAGEGMDHLLARADRDMYVAKRAFHDKRAARPLPVKEAGR